MRFLVDAQLPPALARYLESRGHAAVHVGQLELLNAPDRRIWEYAARDRMILVTKDSDFAALRSQVRDGPPVIWIRIGNTTSQALIRRMDSALPAILAALERGEVLVTVTDGAN